MVKSIKVSVEAAKEVVVEITGGLEVYKEAFLIIHNNARDERRLYCVENDSGNNIYVTCPPKYEHDVVDWLEGFGKIKRVQDVVVYVADEPDYDLDKYADCKIVFSE